MIARFDVRAARFHEREADIRAVRRAVFGGEQGIEPAVDFDGLDAGCRHVVAVADGGAVVGTGRAGTDGRIGRIAVLPEWRRRGVGAAITRALAEAARRQGATPYLHAQAHAVGFYRGLGFTCRGPVFLEAGIEHQEMVVPD